MNFKKLSEMGQCENTKLRVCNKSNPYIKVLQYKASGELKYDQNGMQYIDEKYQYNQIKKLLEKAIEENVELVITPEAAVPFRIIQDIIDNVITPESGSLWCLCVQGLEKNVFKSFIAELKQSEKINIIIENDNQIEYKHHINALYYVFLNNHEKLTIVIQLKMASMRDVSFDNENMHLSKGNTLYIIDLNGREESKNILMSLICADVFQCNSEELIQNIANYSPILLHMQMNPKPFHENMVEFRNDFLKSRCISKQQYIVANWGKGTYIISEENRHQESGSAIYCNLLINHVYPDKKKALNDSEFIKKVIDLQAKCFEYFVDKNYEIWKMHEDIEVLLYILKLGFMESYNTFTGPTFVPSYKDKYKYSVIHDEWEIDNKTCDCCEVEEIIELLAETKMPKEFQDCISRQCENCKRLFIDYFAATILGEEFIEEFITKNEISTRTLLPLNQESYGNSTCKQNLIINLIESFKKREYPPRFDMFKNLPEFIIDVNAALTRSNQIYNIQTKNKNGEHKKAYLSIIDTIRIQEVEQRYEELRRKVAEEYRDSILLYYKDVAGSYVCHSKPYDNTKFTSVSSEFSESGTSISRG